MKYFKNTELAKLYNVSEKSVRNWIQATQEGKLEFQLHEQNGKNYIANTASNTPLIEKLVANGKKYKNTRAYKSIKPLAKFYELYSPKQIFDIISNLEIHNELPRQYNYFDGGAEYWDKYTHRLASEETPNILTSTIKLFNINKSYLDSILKSYKQVNVIDIGVGNALPVKDFLEYLNQQKKLGRYIALDISSEMLDIAERNINDWFGRDITFEGHEIDINYDRFTHLLVDEYIKRDHEDTLNIVMVLGGTLGNLRSPDSAFQVVHDSMSRSDLLIQTQKLDTESTRRYFDFNIDPKSQPLPPQYKFLVDLLNIDASYYEVEMNYDPESKARYLRIRLKVAVSITFEFNDGERTVEFNKDDTILMWRYWHQSGFDVVEQLHKNSFHPLLVSQTTDKEYIFTVSRIACE